MLYKQLRVRYSRSTLEGGSGELMYLFQGNMLLLASHPSSIQHQLGRQIVEGVPTHPSKEGAGYLSLVLEGVWGVAVMVS